MKPNLRNLILATAVSFMSAATANAATTKKPNSPAAPNVVDVNAGQINITFDQTFMTALGSQGVTYSFHGTKSGPNSARGFRVYAGLVDTSSGEGEFTSVGNILFTTPTTTLELSHLTLDTTGQVPVVTAELLVNGYIAGRVPVFTLIVDDLFNVPVQGTSFQTPTVPFAVADSFVTLFNSLFNLKVMTLGLGGGTVSASATIGSIPQ